MYAVVLSAGITYDILSTREDAEVIVSQLRALGRASARVERVS